MNEHEEREHDASSATEGAMHGLASFRPEQALETMATIAREHPHAALAGACALGFVLGGGLTPKLLGAVGMLAARRYFQSAVRDTLEGILHEAKLEAP